MLIQKKKEAPTKSRGLEVNNILSPDTATEDGDETYGFTFIDDGVDDLLARDIDNSRFSRNMLLKQQVKRRKTEFENETVAAEARDEADDDVNDGADDLNGEAAQISLQLGLPAGQNVDEYEEDGIDDEECDDYKSRESVTQLRSKQNLKEDKQVKSIYYLFNII